MEDVVVVVQDQLDMGDGMQCSDHPYTNNPGGICAFCLQDKLGKLVSSSFPTLRVSAASSSSSPSFRSDLAAAAAPSSSSTALSLSIKANAEKFHPTQEYCSTRGATMSFLLARKKKVSANGEDMVFKRSKSTTTPRRTRQRFMDASDELSSPRKRNGFWSFLYRQHKASKKIDSSKISSSSSFASATATTTTAVKSLASSSLRNRTETTTTEVEDDVSSVSPNSQATTGSSFERKVSRSRSVGCGSRSFSGDFFERISTGFGDCSTLRRVESQREGKPGNKQHSSTEHVRCGGLFSGFMMTSSSSSSSSSSYWVSSSANEDVNDRKGVTSSARNGRSSWGSWSFASPMRAFSKPSSSKDGKIRRANNASDKNTTPNLSAIPSLLSVR